VIVVFDTNVLVAALVAKGLCQEAVETALVSHTVASSEPLLTELSDTLRRKFDLGPATTAFLTRLRRHVRLVVPAALPKPVSRDPDDDIVLGTALAARATLIVTGDQDLLILRSYRKVPIVTPRAFLESLPR
jgi:putative PIN family toxin of toxin-antitoxin system